MFVNYLVTFYDADPAGVIFFGNTFRIVHYSLEKCINSGGLYDDFFNNEIYTYPVKQTSADFKRPLSPGQEVKIKFSILEIRESSFSCEFTIYNNDNNVVAVVNTVHVCLEKKTGNKKPIPENILQFLKSI